LKPIDIILLYFPNSIASYTKFPQDFKNLSFEVICATEFDSKAKVIKRAKKKKQKKNHNKVGRDNTFIFETDRHHPVLLSK